MLRRSHLTLLHHPPHTSGVQQGMDAQLITSHVTSSSATHNRCSTRDGCSTNHITRRGCNSTFFGKLKLPPAILNSFDMPISKIQTIVSYLQNSAGYTGGSKLPVFTIFALFLRKTSNNAKTGLKSRKRAILTPPCRRLSFENMKKWFGFLKSACQNYLKKLGYTFFQNYTPLYVYDRTLINYGRGTFMMSCASVMNCSSLMTCSSLLSCASLPACSPTFVVVFLEP